MRIIVLFILLVSFSIVRAQDLFPKEDITVKSLFLSLDEKHPDMVKFINNNENKYVLDFNSDIALKYPDPIKNPNKIKFVSLSFRSNDDLEKQILLLKTFPNLEYLEINTAVQFRKSDIKKELTLPKNIGTLSHLRYLQISGSYNINFSVFFETLKQIPHLEYIGMPHIWENLELPASFLELDQLRGIKVEGFKEFYFPKDMSAMENLQSIVMVPEQYQNINEEFRKFSTLPHLQQLTFYYGKFSNENLLYFKEFKELKSLSFTNNEFEDIQKLVDNLPENNTLESLKLLNLQTKGEITNYSKLKNLKSLEIQSYSGANFKIHEGLYDLKKLESLNLSSDSLYKISNKIGNLEKLKILTLSYNKIVEIPEEIGKLKNLKQLFLDQNSLKELPETLGNLEMLEEFRVQNNALEKLPTSFSHLRALKTLNLSNNLLTKLPSDFSNLTRLEILNLNINSLNELPNQIGNLQSLKEFYAQYNYLTELPSTIVNLKNLESLDLSYNDLNSLPHNFGNLQKLRFLLLGGNNKGEQIKTYGGYQSVGQENRLRKLVFNHIKYLPSSFSKLPNLERIFLNGMSSLDEKNLFEILFDLESKKYNVEITECGIQNLPKDGWESFLATELRMAGSVINKIPKDIINAPYLTDISFKLDKEDGLSYNLSGKNELLAFYEEKGFIDFKSLPKTSDLAKAYLSNAYNRKYTSGGNILELIGKAFKLDSSYTATHVRADDYADALLENADYEKSIIYYTKAIEVDTARGPYILNFILPHFQNRAQAYLATGDTLAAVNDLYIISNRFNSGDWGKAALLAKKIGKDSLASKYFKNGTEFYMNQIKARKESNNTNFGYQLSLLEFYIIEEDFEMAQRYYKQLKNENVTPADKEVLLQYFGFVLDILNNDFDETRWGNFIENIQNIKIESWSFELFKIWINLSKISQNQKHNILTVTDTLTKI